MFIRRVGFTLVELMIVIAIIGILASAIYPAASAYYARGRDVGRISNIKDLFLNFQNYARANSIYPSNTDSTGFFTSYCVSDILDWAPASTQKDKQFDQLGGTGTMRADPVLSQSNIGACPKAGSYFYARLTREAPYGVVAARMERQATGANYSGNLLIPSPANIDPMIQARPLDPSSDDADKIFLLISN